MAEGMLCAVPARGGSKRLPRKNLRELAGKPLIAYTIEAALQSGLFQEVYVCTEDEEIASIARRYGACVPMLVPAELCGDLVASHIPCQHVAKYRSDHGQVFEALVCLQPTSPLRSVQDIQAAAERFRQGHCDFLVSVTALDPHEFHWAITLGDDGYWKMYFGDQYMKERLDLPPVHRPNGSVKIASLAKLAETGHFFGERLDVVETPPERSVHVAQEFDLRLCEAMLAEQRQ